MPTDIAPAELPQISVVLSFRNECETLPELINRLVLVLENCSPSYEIIFVDDASDDGSSELLATAHTANPHIKIVKMSRRFGVTECLLAGFEASTGDAVIFLDADLQDPPELIPELIKKWHEGFEVVHTRRSKRLGEPVFKQWLTKAAYKVISSISSITLPEECGDYKLISRRVLKRVLDLKEPYPYLRGMICWVGFPQTVVDYVRAPRFGGKTHYSLLKSLNPIRTLINGVVNYSDIPLIGMGVLLVVASAISTLLAVTQMFSSFHSFLQNIIMALQSAGLAVALLYLRAVTQATFQRPKTIIKENIGFDA